MISIIFLSSFRKIKKAFYASITDGDDSVLSEVKRVVNETNEIFEEIESELDGKIDNSKSEALNFAESERQKSKNLFNKDGILRGKEIVSNTGGVIDNSNYWVSDYINIKGMSNLYLSGPRTDGRSNCYYDENKNFISVERLENCVGLLTPPSNAVYMRFNGYLHELDGVQLEEGTVATDFQTYNGATVREKQLKETVNNISLIFY